MVTVSETVSIMLSGSNSARCSALPTAERLRLLLLSQSVGLHVVSLPLESLPRWPTARPPKRPPSCRRPCHIPNVERAQTLSERAACRTCATARRDREHACEASQTRDAGVRVCYRLELRHLPESMTKAEIT